MSDGCLFVRDVGRARAEVWRPLAIHSREKSIGQNLGKAVVFGVWLVAFIRVTLVMVLGRMALMVPRAVARDGQEV